MGGWFSKIRTKLVLSLRGTDQSVPWQSTKQIMRQNVLNARIALWALMVFVGIAILAVQLQQMRKNVADAPIV